MVILHGVGGNGRLLEFIAVPLWMAGYEVICPDLPLYGLTKYKGTVSYEDWIRCGVYVCRKYARCDLPLFLFGLSAGGMLAYQVACKVPKVDGLIITCILDQRIAEVTMKTASSPFMAAAGKPFLRCTHRFFESIKLPMKAVCNMKAIVNNTELAEILMRDKLSTGTSVSLEFLYGMLNPLIEMEPEQFMKCPVLLVHPGEDQWTDPRLSRLFFNRIAADKEYNLLKGAGHFPIEEQGLRELENDCIQFMDKNGRK